MEYYLNPNEFNGVPPPLPLIRRDGGIEVFDAYTVIAGKQVRVERKADHAGNIVEWFVLERCYAGWKEVSIKADTVVFSA